MYDRLIGGSNIDKINVCGVNVTALIDSVSMVTLMSEDFYDFLDPKPKLKGIHDFELNVYGAAGVVVPYLGYVEARAVIPKLSHREVYVPILVTPSTEYHCHVPVIIGTNVIRLCRDFSIDEEVPEV